MNQRRVCGDEVRVEGIWMEVRVGIMGRRRNLKQTKQIYGVVERGARGSDQTCDARRSKDLKFVFKSKR